MRLAGYVARVEANRNKFTQGFDGKTARKEATRERIILK
jgi:hypothetical protein